MTAVNAKPEVRPYSETHIANQSFDANFQVSVTEPLVYDANEGTLNRMTQPTTPTDIQSIELITVLRALLLAITNPPYLDKSANAIRNQVQSGTVTTVGTVTNLTNFGSMGADVMLRLTTLNTWAANVRSLIT